MKRSIQKLFKSADDALMPIDCGGDPKFAKECLQQILDSPDATEEDKAQARSMMHQAIDEAANLEFGC
jgi:hypothetical protein